MLVNGYSIEEYPLPRSSLRIRTTSAFDQEEARIAAGLSRSEFEELPGDPEWIMDDAPISLSKADVLVAAYYRRLLEVVQSVEATRKK